MSPTLSAVIVATGYTRIAVVNGEVCYVVGLSILRSRHPVELQVCKLRGEVVRPIEQRL
jgi:hypothetical protein